jgi:predicted AlkP superfamily phosphohydrolase/phosphomutase
MPATDAPILIFVLSEASPVLAKRWIDEGKLPFLARMAQCGSAGKLQANLPYNTVQAFADIFTGQRAQQHATFDYVQRDSRGQLREADRRSIGCSTLWDILDCSQRTCGIVNLPLTWPPQPVLGYMISGQDSPVVDRRIASPPELYDQLTSKFGRYRLKDIFPGGRDKQDYLALFPQEIDWQCEVLAELIATQPCDLFMAFVSATAMAQHYFWSDMEDADKDNPYSGTIESVYRRIDAQLARLAQLAGPRARIFVISECGAGPLKHGVDLNAWLHTQGFLHYQDSGSDTSLRSRALAAAVSSAKRYLPAAAKTLLADRFPRLKAKADTYMAVAGVDWSRTAAYSRGKESFIYLNLAGREPNGIVSVDQYSITVAKIAARLHELFDPDTGEAVVNRVFTRDELYPGCTQPGAPDLVIDWKNGSYMPTEANRRSNQVFGPRWRAGMSWPTSGSHRPEGIFFAQGPGIEAGYRVQSANTLDLLPTWLRMLDIPAPEDLPGRVIECCCGGRSESPNLTAFA